MLFIPTKFMELLLHISHWEAGVRPEQVLPISGLKYAESGKVGSASDQRLSEGDWVGMDHRKLIISLGFFLKIQRINHRKIMKYRYKQIAFLPRSFTLILMKKKKKKKITRPLRVFSSKKKRKKKDNLLVL